ncbi:MAG TPA: outer membrane beta-barrel protein [Vicinamibacterales bacterium]|nr:outer membrane beta-barrel protein [Vicinamibacterales bacterium]
MACIAAVLPLAGCGWLPNAYSGCDEPQPYESAQQVDVLRVPSGADLPDTRNALKIPVVKSPELPKEPGTCLDHPPAFGTSPQARVAAASGVSDAAGGGAAEVRLPPVDMDDGSPWQARIGATYQPTTDVDFDGGSTVEFNSSTGFTVGVGYELSRYLELGATINYDERDYEGMLAGDAPGEVFPVRGGLDTMGVMFDLSYYFLTGRFRPFIGTGVGWSFLDTNVATQPPQVGCWWNPWYGYVCDAFQDTKSVDGFAYQAIAGVQYRWNPSFSMSGSYRMSWLDVPKADGTPTFDAIQLILNWGF